MLRFIPAFSLMLSLAACAPVPAIKVHQDTMIEAYVKTLTQERRAAMLARVEKDAIGFSAGPRMPNKAWVFFDPYCSYCSDLWRVAGHLRDQVEFVWIPVALLGDDSAVLGALTLESADPASIMWANEEAMRLSGTAVTLTATPSDASLAKVTLNTELMNSMDPALPIQAVPLTYYRSSKGQIEIIGGAMEAQALKAAMQLK